jgi:hypothetical protein
VARTADREPVGEGDLAAQIEQARAVSAEASAPTEATTFLDRARRELTEVCRQFDGAVPFFRLNNTMQNFSDKLDDRERALLAQEIGADSSHTLGDNGSRIPRTARRE